MNGSTTQKALQKLLRNKTSGGDAHAVDTLERILKWKIRKLKSAYGIDGISRWDQYLRGYQFQMGSILGGDDEFSSLLLPLPSAAYQLGQKTECIGAAGQAICAVSCPKAIIFKNPFNGKIESWSKLKFVYGRKNGPHGSSSKNKNKSIFLKGVREEPLITDAFHKPFGILKDCKTLFLYMNFRSSIGRIKNGDKETSWLCVQCDRMKREKGSGYQIVVHGYPCSREEVEKEFSNYPLLRGKII